MIARGMIGASVTPFLACGGFGSNFNQMQCVNRGETEALLLLLVGFTTKAAALRFFAVAISAALLLRHLVRLF